MLANSKLIDRSEDCGNGYGWSIIQWLDDFCYGDCYEIAVLKDGKICYDSGLTNDVIRGDWDTVNEICKKIMEINPDRLSS